MKVDKDYDKLCNGIKALKEKLRGGICVDTLEKTRQWLVLPLLSALGYDVLSTDVVPHFVDIKEGLNTYDYALTVGDTTVVVIKCIKKGNLVRDVDFGMLAEAVLKENTTIGIITDGVIYDFYYKNAETGILEKNKYFEFNVDYDIKEHVERLYKYSKNNIQTLGMEDYTNIEAFKHECETLFNNLFKLKVPEYLLKLVVAKSRVNGVSIEKLKEYFNAILKEEVANSSWVANVCSSEKKKYGKESWDSFPVTSASLRGVKSSSLREVRLLGKSKSVTSTGKIMDFVLKTLLVEELLTEKELVNLSKEMEMVNIRFADSQIPNGFVEIKGTSLMRKSYYYADEAYEFLAAVIAFAGLNENDVLVSIKSTSDCEVQQ